jgi:hypothetical protein
MYVTTQKPVENCYFKVDTTSKSVDMRSCRNKEKKKSNLIGVKCWDLANVGKKSKPERQMMNNSTSSNSE